MVGREDPREAPQPQPFQWVFKALISLALIAMLVINEVHAWNVTPEQPELMGQVFWIRATIISALAAALVGQSPPVISGLRRFGSGMASAARNVFNRGI